MSDSVEAIFVEIDEILGTPVLLDDEMPSSYLQLRDLIRKAIAPTDAIEVLWVCEMANDMWELARNRRLKSSFHALAEIKGATSIIHRMDGYTLEAQDFSAAVAAGEPAAQKKFRKRMEAANLDADVLTAAAMSAEREAFEFFDAMISRLTGRIGAVPKEILRRREVIARQLQAIPLPFDDAEVILEEEVEQSHQDQSEPSNAGETKSERQIDEEYRKYVAIHMPERFET